MQVMTPKGLLSDLHRTASWQPDSSRTPIEHLVEFILTGSLASNAPRGIQELAEQVLNFDLRGTRAVVLGGGTGLSTIVGGNSQGPDWPDFPWVGAKEDFSRMDVIVCTTDDGGSTGRLLQSLPMIGIGDLRKLLISSIRYENLNQQHNVAAERSDVLVKIIHALFNHRFEENESGIELLRDPLLLIEPDLRPACPQTLSGPLRELGDYLSPGGGGPVIPPAGHAMGNLLLTAAIFMAAKGRTDRPPGLREIQSGIDRIASLVGAPAGRIHPATSAPGQLVIRYANGVEVYGQSKSARARRGYPIERVTVEFARKPVVGAAVLNAIESSDLIIYAPGSLYTSIIPILQLDPVVEAIRRNKRALKVLGANSWIQEGETDISLKNEGRGFLVSELIEAYGRNVHQGVADLFDVVLSANLEHVPGHILRNYALEGKSPIHLDRPQVESMGLHPVEATLFSPERQLKSGVIHHDPRKFSLAIRTLLYADSCLRDRRGFELRRSNHQKTPLSHKAGKLQPDNGLRKTPVLCNYLRSIREAVDEKEFRPAELRSFLIDLAWENRDISPSHLSFFRGAHVIPARGWNRSTEWDNVLGYYDPEDQCLKLHNDLLSNHPKLQEDMLVALGESLLGRYLERRRWIEQHGSRTYEIVLRPPLERQCFLTENQLNSYLRLARMIPDPDDNRIFRLTLNSDEGFLPPGLLFGLFYAWYLTGSGLTMEYEMTLLRRPLKSLIPLHAKDRIRKEALVTFFRTEIFGHRP
jgi:uncharacterized cofD-like protein